jgi:hypothetical protein
VVTNIPEECISSIFGVKHNVTTQKTMNGILPERQKIHKTLLLLRLQQVVIKPMSFSKNKLIAQCGASAAVI